MIQQLIKSAYIIQALVQDDELDIKFNGKYIEFKIFDTDIKTDTKEFFISTIGDDSINIEIKNEDDLYGYIAVQVMKHTSMNRHKDRICDISQIPKYYIEMMDKVTDRLDISRKLLFELACFTIGSPKTVACDIQLHETVVKYIRILNRKRIIKFAKEQGLIDYNNAINSNSIDFKERMNG